METGLSFWFLAICASIFVGLGKGGMPVIAGLAVPSLSLLMSPIAAASLLLPVYIVSDIFALKAYRNNYNWQVLRIGMIGMTLGVLIGWLTAHVVIEWVITLCIGLMGVLFAGRSILFKSPFHTKTKSVRALSGYFWTTLAGFTSFISHNGGPPWQIFVIPFSLSKSIFVGTSVIAFSYCNAIKLIPYYFLGQIDLSTVSVTLYLMIPASLAVFVGVKLVQYIPEPIFFKVVTWALLFISLKLIYDALITASL